MKLFGLHVGRETAGHWLVTMTYDYDNDLAGLLAISY